MQGQARIDREARAVALAALLTNHPHGFIAAIDDRGGLVPVPDSLPLGEHRVIPGAFALHLVARGDRDRVISAWEQARARGASQVRVRLTTGDAPVNMSFIDATEDHGAFISFVAAVDGDDLELPEPEEQGVVTRVAQTKKNDVSEYIEADERITAMLGWTPDELVGRRSLDVIHPDDVDRAIEAWMTMLTTPGGRSSVRLRHLCADGSWMWVEIVNHNMLDHPEHPCVVGEMVDITNEMAAHEMLQAREQLLHRIAEALPIGLLQVDVDGNVTYTNERLHEVLGTPAGSTVDAQLAGVLPVSRTVLRDALDAALRHGGDDDIEVQLGDADSTATRHCAVRIRALTNEHGVTGAILCVEDVTESAQLRKELQRRASFDMLTGCRNRPSVLAALEQALGRRDPTSTAVIFVDIDRFKPVNDRLGHAAGDQLLRIVGTRLNGVVRAGDVVGRIGGDEFLVIGAVSGPDEAMEIAWRITGAFNDPILIGEGEIEVRASIGVACSSGDTEDADELVAEADTAMYEAKRNGGGHPVMFDPQIAGATAG